MLSVFPKSGKFDGRAFLRIGSLGLGGIALSHLLAHQALATDQADPLTGKSVIFLFLHGGPSQTETCGPEMTAPPGIQTATGEVSTNIPSKTWKHGGCTTKSCSSRVARSRGDKPRPKSPPA